MQKERSLRFVALVALGWAAADAFFFGQGAIAGILCLVGILYLLPRAIAARADPARLRLRLSKALVTVAAGALALAALVYGNRVAEERAHGIIAAVEAFRGKHGRYPDRLAELVPAFLPEVPSAKPVVLASSFRYWKSESKPLLMYVVVPPFGRRIYAFEERKWTELD